MQGNGEELNALLVGSCVGLNKQFKLSFVHGTFLILFICDFRVCGLICRSLSLAATSQWI